MARTVTTKDTKKTKTNAKTIVKAQADYKVEDSACLGTAHTYISGRGKRCLAVNINPDKIAQLVESGDSTVHYERTQTDWLKLNLVETKEAGMKDTKEADAEIKFKVYPSTPKPEATSIVSETADIAAIVAAVIAQLS